MRISLTRTGPAPVTQETDMRKAATKACYGIRALVLIPTMLVLGLAIRGYDWSVRKLGPEPASDEIEKT